MDFSLTSKLNPTYKTEFSFSSFPGYDHGFVDGGRPRGEDTYDPSFVDGLSVFIDDDEGFGRGGGGGGGVGGEFHGICGRIFNLEKLLS